MEFLKEKKLITSHQNDIKEFEEERKKKISLQKSDKAFQTLTHEWIKKSLSYKYTYNFNWLGLPIIQYPQDIVAMQEIIWTIKPDLIIETGVARGGSVIFYASMLSLLQNNGQVIGIDIDFRKHNIEQIKKNLFSKYIHFIEGSSTDLSIIAAVERFVQKSNVVLVVLDSLHTHDHVLQELKLYAPFVSSGSYIVVFDTIIEKFDDTFFVDRPWEKGNNPYTAVQEFLNTTKDFFLDDTIEQKLMITNCPGGYLKKINGNKI